MTLQPGSKKQWVGRLTEGGGVDQGDRMGGVGGRGGQGGEREMVEGKRGEGRGWWAALRCFPSAYGTGAFSFSSECIKIMGVLCQYR